jgi:hypothetical protein
MEKGARKKTREVAICAAIVFLCACVGVNATTLDVNAMQISIPGQFYSYSAGSGSLNFSSRSCSVPTLVFADGSSNYSITGAKLTFSSALVTDTSQDYMASGLFQGGGTLTLTGGLKYKPTGEIILPANSTLVVANMRITSDETWLLQELPATTINGSIYFSPDTTVVGLGMGITYGTDTLRLENFRLDFSFKGLSPNPNDFSTGNISGTTSTIGIAATAPEPATVFLFTIAALAFRINKKK